MPVTTLILAAILVLSTRGAAVVPEPPLFTDAFPIEEFAARRMTVMERLGDAAAILQGAADYPAYVRFRQNNHFFYLTGVEVPRAILVLDGRTRRATLFLPPRDERLERSEGPVLVPGDDARRITGIGRVEPRASFDQTVSDLSGRTVYTPFRMESLGAGTPDRTAFAAARAAADSWDARPSRESAFADHLRQRTGGSTVRDLDPILDELRMVKSPREIALVREATRIAGEAIIETMRSAQVGMAEYELAAIGDYFFRRANAQGPAYYALVASGQNAFYPHYHAAQGTLADGDLVLYDYAPDFKYYTSDVTREFPANGRFTGAQRELYDIYTRLYRSLMQSIRPGLAPRTIIRDAVARMDNVVSQFPFTSDRARRAAGQFVDAYRRDTGHSLGHMVGLEVHDVEVPFDTLRPGMIFTIEPALTIPDDRVYIRIEDPILITETGYENLSEFVPTEIEAIERVMAETGIFERRVTPSTRP